MLQLIRHIFKLRIVTMILVVSFCCIIHVMVLYAAEPLPWGEMEDERAASNEEDFDEEMAQSEMQGSVKGEVAGVNNASKTITLKEDNQGTGQFDTSVYFVNSATTFEGVGSLSYIGVGDIISMDYFIFKDKNIVDNVVFEKKYYSDD